MRVQRILCHVVIGLSLVLIGGCELDARPRGPIADAPRAPALVIPTVQGTPSHAAAPLATTQRVATVPIPTPTLARAAPTATPNDLPPITDVAALDTQQIWVARGTTVYTSSDGGATWHPGTSFHTPIGALARLDAQHGWVSTDTALWMTADGGQTWTSIGPPVTALHFSDLRRGWGVWHGLVITQDGGHTWQTRVWPDEPGCAVFAGNLSFISPTEGWALCITGPGAGHQGKFILHTHDGARTWHWPKAPTSSQDASSGRLPDTEYAGTIFFLDAQHGWVSMGRDREAKVYRTNDGGSTWSIAGYAGFTTIDAIVMTSPSTGVGLGFSSDLGGTVLLRTTDRGATWQIVPVVMR